MRKLYRSLLICFWLLWLCRIVNRRLSAQHLINTFRRYICPRDNNRHHRNHQKRHDDLHRILDKCHQIADLHGATVNRIASTVNNQHGNAVHNDHHNRHHKGHASVDKQIRPCQILIGLLKALLLMLLRTEGTGDHDTGQLLSCDQIQTVDQLLQLRKPRHRYLKQYSNNNHDQNDRQCDNPAHRYVRFYDLEHTADTENR